MSETDINYIHWLLKMIHNVDAGMVVLDRQADIRLWNGFFEYHTGIKASAVVGKKLYEVLPDISRQWITERLDQVFNSGSRTFTNWEARPFLTTLAPVRPITSTAGFMYQNASFIPLENPRGEIDHVCMMLYDVTDVANNQLSLNHEIDQRIVMHDELLDLYIKKDALVTQLEETQTQLLQSEKMASVGQLAAGVAHEINNPIGFVHSNLNTLKGYTEDLIGLLGLMKEATALLPDSEPLKQKIVDKMDAADIDYLIGDTQDLVDESMEGTGRVRKIVQDLKDFSRVGEERWEWTDIESNIESTLNICWNEIKYKCTVDKQYSPLPRVECIPSQLNQVILNMLVNAAQAIEEKGTITIKTEHRGDLVTISVADTGKGIDGKHLSKIFDPFYTTKPIGKGTGLGLSIAYGIIQRHAGDIDVDSTPGEGTRFEISIPVEQKKEQG